MAGMSHFQFGWGSDLDATGENNLYVTSQPPRDIQNNVPYPIHQQPWHIQNNAPYPIHQQPWHIQNNVPYPIHQQPWHIQQSVVSYRYMMPHVSKELLEADLRQSSQQIGKLSETIVRLSQEYSWLLDRYSQLGGQYCQLLNQERPKHNPQASPDPQRSQSSRFEWLSDQYRLEVRIVQMFQHHPKIRQFRLAHECKIVECKAHIYTDLELLEYLSTVRQSALEVLGVPFSDVEKEFEDRYGLHPSVFKNRPHISGALIWLINMRSNATYLKDPFWIKHGEFRDKLKRECSKFIDRWLNPTEDRPYSEDQEWEKVNELQTQLRTLAF